VGSKTSQANIIAGGGLFSEAIVGHDPHGGSVLLGSNSFLAFAAQGPASIGNAG
jgi:hypothetical protein